MKSIWKYDLPITDEPVVEMQQGAKVLHVASQDGRGDVVQVWALVDPIAPSAAHHFAVRGTGHDVEDELCHEQGRGQYVGTVITTGGMLVWHVFDLGE